MRKVAYIVLTSTYAKVNTLYKAQVSFDLKNIKSNEVIDLINVKVVVENRLDEHPFIARVWQGDGSPAEPFVIALEARKGEKDNVNIGFMYRGQTQKVEVFIP